MYNNKIQNLKCE